MRHQGSWWNSY